MVSERHLSPSKQITYLASNRKVEWRGEMGLVAVVLSM